MSSAASGRNSQPPPDSQARARALDTSRSILVEAPAGSGKTDLLTRRFLRLLGQVDEPGKIVAITFTKAAAAEMRHRILAELEKAAGRNGAATEGLPDLSMESLAARALARSNARGWNLIELPAQLRILTIDSFCREIALQRPLLSELGGALDIAAHPAELYRRAARRVLEQIDEGDPELRTSIAALLEWRDNGWQELENLLVKMLAQRDRWMHGFVLEREQDWEALRKNLERPFARGAGEKLLALHSLLERVPHARQEALELARFGCEQTAGSLYRELAELAEFPRAPFTDAEQIEAAREACACLAKLLLTKDDEFRKRVDKSIGFPAGRKVEKDRLARLISDLAAVPGLEAALAAIADLPPVHYSEEDWRIVRACFALLRRAAAELKVVFAEQGAVDYTEVAQIALKIVRGDENGPADAALAAADNIRHLLVDEFQDTSRRQHELLTNLIAAWPEREGRSCFVVGDPMQSIYSFRDADAELFSRVRDNGFEIASDTPFVFDSARLTANFRAANALVREIDSAFTRIFSQDDGSGISFVASHPARADGLFSALQPVDPPRIHLRVNFQPHSPRSAPLEEKQRIGREREAVQTEQAQAIVALIRSHSAPMEAARASGGKYRIAVLGRTKKALAPVAAGLRKAGIAFAAVDLEKLNNRPEVQDALALARALLNPHDRVAWLGVLRAPWCGLSLADLHALAGSSAPAAPPRPIPELLAERASLLSPEGSAAIARISSAFQSAAAARASRLTLALGTWIEQAWLRLGGAACVDRAARANLDLLWKCLDELPEGEQGILGPALDAALDELTALPDPDADPDCGVQLMTIHKAKGLEFETVIVPELQAGAARSRSELLLWMERGLAAPDSSGEVSEFLVAPIQARGSDGGQAKKWVDRARREREAQEMRRLLYVAMTRAREELYLFARLSYKTDDEGSLELIMPKDCLAAAALPALEDEIRAQFGDWRAAAAPAAILSIAAAEESPAEMPEPIVLRRLPADFQIAEENASSGSAATLASDAANGPLFRRHEGGLKSRALGIAVHALLQELARLRLALDWPAASEALAQLAPRLAAQARASGIERGQSARIAGQALEIALDASRDPWGQWILAPHAGAASEVRWAGLIDGGVRVVQVDRVFRAGALPKSEGDEAWWVIDYKTAHAEEPGPAKILPELRQQFAPQLEVYARVLRNLHGSGARIFAGLYYPRMKAFDWWEA